MVKQNRHRYRHIVSWCCGLFFLAIIAWAGIVYLYRPAYIIPDTTEWNTGDIFFSVGDSWESVAVRAITGARSFELSDSTPSHCGIVIRHDGGVGLVHESTIAKKIVVETPEEYLKNNGSYCLYVRQAPCEPDSIVLLHTVDSLISKGIPFDFDFDHLSSESLYCTEMVIRISELCGCFCFSGLRDRKYIYPTDLLEICVKP